LTESRTRRTWINVDLYYSEDDREEHSALRDVDGDLRAGICSYPLISVDLEDLSEHGFTAKKGGKAGKKHFELRTYVQMTGTSDKLEITIDAMEHYYHFPEERNGQPYSKDSVLWSFTRELWNKSMSHFVRNITGTATPAVAPAGHVTPQHISIKRKASASTGFGRRQTAKRATRKRAIDYAEDQDME
jgi:hypothetical protein